LRIQKHPEVSTAKDIAKFETPPVDSWRSRAPNSEPGSFGFGLLVIRAWSSVASNAFSIHSGFGITPMYKQTATVPSLARFAKIAARIDSFRHLAFSLSLPPDPIYSPFPPGSISPPSLSADNTKL
jgi:hypothetical protein